MGQINNIIAVLTRAVGVVLLYVFAFTTAASVLIAVVSAAQGHPLNEPTLRLVGNAFSFSLGILTGWAIHSVFKSAVNDQRDSG